MCVAIRHKYGAQTQSFVGWRSMHMVEGCTWVGIGSKRSSFKLVKLWIPGPISGPLLPAGMAPNPEFTEFKARFEYLSEKPTRYLRWMCKIPRASRSKFRKLEKWFGQQRRTPNSESYEFKAEVVEICFFVDMARYPQIIEFWTRCVYSVSFFLVKQAQTSMPRSLLPRDWTEFNTSRFQDIPGWRGNNVFWHVRKPKKRESNFRDFCPRRFCDTVGTPTVLRHTFLQKWETRQNDTKRNNRTPNTENYGFGVTSADIKWPIWIPEPIKYQVSSPARFQEIFFFCPPRWPQTHKKVSFKFFFLRKEAKIGSRENFKLQKNRVLRFVALIWKILLSAECSKHEEG